MISVENLSLQFGGQRIFNNVSLLVKPKDRIGLVGKNGAGKSTLLRLIVKEQVADQGKIIFPGDLTVGYLPQQLACNDTKTVYEEALSAFSEINKLEKDLDHLNQQLSERTDYESASYMELVEMLAEKTDRLHIMSGSNKDALCEQTLKGLGFLKKDFDRPTGEFSGGWRMRVELAKILLRSPDVFLLDEPTNHLDIESIQWLENFLANYHGAVILISHDRTFLDNVTNRTVEITLGQFADYNTSYSKYVEQRKERKEQQMAAYRNQQKQIEETKEFIERFRYKATKAVQVQSRVKQLEKIDIIEVEEEDIASMNIKFPPAPRSGRIVFEASDLSKNYGKLQVLNNIDFKIERGEKIAFVGKNGEGKSTLLKIITNELEASGDFQLGTNVKLGYFAQNQDELLDENKTVFDTIDAVAIGDIRTKIRDILGAFLFSGETVDKKVKVLSGGEKSRLSMAKLLLEPYNLLVLDEPTNHLDMRSKDILKQALLAYDGTLIVVSHDREFLDGLTDMIYEFRNKKIKEFRGGIFEFLHKKKLESLQEFNTNSKLNNTLNQEPEERKQQNKLSYLEKKEFDKKVRKVERKIKQIEKDIETIESRQVEIEKLLAAGNSDPEIFNEYEENKKKNDTLLTDWEEESAKLEKLLNNNG